MSTMLARFMKAALLLTGVSGAAMASGLLPPPGPLQSLSPGTQTQPANPLSRMIQQVPMQTVQSVPPPNPALSDPLMGVIDQWKRIEQSDNLPFADYANFLLAHPGWPGETSRRAAAETAPDTYGSPALTARFFDRFPPLTGAGHGRYAQALLATGQSPRAYEQARLAWRKGVLRPGDEAAVLGTFAAALTPDDHDARIDMLLWQGAAGTAQRMLAYASPARRGVFLSRIAYRSGAPDAAIQGAAAEAAGLADAGWIADRATWMRNSGAGATARTQLAQPRTLSWRPTAPEKWYEVLLTAARGAAADGQYALAYDIARQIDDAYAPGTDVSMRPLGERDDYTSLAWLAGTTALKQLGRARDAVAMFDRYARGSRTPTTQSKGYYWAGRAAETAGDRAGADVYYARAAGFSDLYYGQLAAERLRQPLRAPAPVQTAGIDPATRARFDARETVRAVRLLGQLGRFDEQSRFVRQIAADATTDTDHALAADLSRAINRPDLGVMVGRSALQNGLSDYTAAGYPSVPVPSASNDYWTMVHAIARQESQFNRAAVSHAGARGIMQLMPGTARETAGKLGLGYNPASLTTDTDYNIQLGSHYFARMYAMYGSYPLAVAAYNAGPGNVNKWLRANGDPRSGGVDMVDWVEKIPIFETRNYVQRVLENAVVYDLLHPQRARSRGPSNLSWYLGKSQPG